MKKSWDSKEHIIRKCWQKPWYINDKVINTQKMSLCAHNFSCHLIISDLFVMLMYLVLGKFSWLGNWLWKYKDPITLIFIQEKDLLSEILMTPLWEGCSVSGSSNTRIDLFPVYVNPCTSSVRGTYWLLVFLPAMSDLGPLNLMTRF